MHCSSFFQFAAFATLAALVDVSCAAPQAPNYAWATYGFAQAPKPSVMPTMPQSNPRSSSVSSVCFTSSKAPAIRGRPTTQYTTLTTCTTTSTKVVTATVSPPPAVTTTTVVTTSTTTGPTVTDTATSTTVTTTTAMTTLPVSPVNAVTTVTQTVSVSASSDFKNAADTSPPATFSKRKRLATRLGISPNTKFNLGALPAPFGGDVSCVIYQSQCAVVTQTITSTTTLASTTVTSVATSTVVVTSIPIANTTVTATSTITTTSTITPVPTTTTSTVSTTSTTTVQADPCTPNNMIGGINGIGIDGVYVGNYDFSFTGASSASNCCLAATGNPIVGYWMYYSESCYLVSASTCSGIDQSEITGYVDTSSSYASGAGFIVGNANCGQFNSWSQVD